MSGALKFLTVLCNKNIPFEMNLQPLWLGEMFIRVVYQSLYSVISFVVCCPGWMWWEGFPEHKGTCSGDKACSSMGDIWLVYTMVEPWPLGGLQYMSFCDSSGE